MTDEQKRKRLDIIEEFLMIDDWSWQYSDIDSVLIAIANEYREDLGLQNGGLVEYQDIVNEEMFNRIFEDITNDEMFNKSFKEETK